MLRFSPNPNRAALIPWQEWSDDAFRAATEQDKPVLLFLSAFWCRYCQRMDEEAFSQTENIALLKAYFVSIRVENAQRPEIDARYNFNGWPTVAFLSPAGQLLAAVNYLDAETFKNVLLDVYMAYQQRKSESSATAESEEGPVGASAGQDDEQVFAANLLSISNGVMTLADRAHGGYGHGQKFIQAEVNEFLLKRFETTRDSACLDHVCLTLDNMRLGAIHDRAAGGYFRTTTGADWSEPHREKLLLEQAGLLSNCLHAFRLTQDANYAAMAAEIVAYLNHCLFDPGTGAFYGCEDFLRSAIPARSAAEEYFSIVDECIYVDANAVVISAYLDAATILKIADCRERALAALDFIWAHCRSPQGVTHHLYQGSVHAPPLLSDQALLGLALVHSYGASGKPVYFEWAEQLAQFVLTCLRNPAGGYFDVPANHSTSLGSRLTLIEANGPTALFFMALGDVTKAQKYFDAARWALRSFRGDLGSCGVLAAAYGSALDQYLNRRQNHR